MRSDFCVHGLYLQRMPIQHSYDHLQLIYSFLCRVYALGGGIGEPRSGGCGLWAVAARRPHVAAQRSVMVLLVAF